jgi:leucyl aminopeptidase
VHLVLVGKGITFDTGGINRKAGNAMQLMHTDMSGAAAVLASLRAAAAQRLPVRITALVPIAENSLSGSSYRPGDVIRQFGGRTSEVGNTDAEGRLVLADALAYASSRLRPTTLVDIATLTGAAKVALGLRTAGLFATTDELAAALDAAGDAAGEPLWRLPLLSDYEATLRSDIADATNAPGNPGAITAALFLRRFVGRVPWAHLDIAGPARAPEDDGIFARGATGFGARLLHRWLESLS